MNKDRRFGRRIAEPSSVQIIHELKVMALRQSLDAATRREAAEASLSEQGLGNGSSPTPVSDPA